MAELRLRAQDEFLLDERSDEAAVLATTQSLMNQVWGECV